jgi:hypothetical protein
LRKRERERGDIFLREEMQGKGPNMIFGGLSRSKDFTVGCCTEF